MSYHLIVVDGTGPWEDRDYFKSMADSFCMQIRDTLGKARVDYERGPSDLGSECGDQSTWVVGRCYLAAQRGEKIFLAGYSRGGGVIIDAAHRYPHAIDSVFLFDAVDRSVKIDGYSSNCNVDYVYHVLRDPTISDPLFSGEKYSRAWFGNCGLSGQWPGRVKYRQFRVPGASHASVGGVPWLEREEDKPALRMAAKWMTGVLHQRGVPVTLRDKWFDTYREAEFKQQQAREEAERRARARVMRGPKF